MRDWAAMMARNPTIRLGGDEEAWVGRVVRLATAIRNNADRQRRDLELL